MKKCFLLFLLIGLFNTITKAQCDTPYAPGTTCEDAPLFCEGIDGFCNSLSPSTETYGTMPGCNNEILENPHYIKFIAGSTFVKLNISRSNCVGGNFGFTGVQAGLYENSCESIVPLAVSCINFAESLSLAAFVEPGQTYLLLIDGQFGAYCDYSIDVVEGSTVAPDFSDTDLSVSGPEFVQQNGTYTFSTESITGADYEWTIFGGDVVSGVGSNEVSVNVTTDFYFAVCVFADGACSDQTEQVCKDYIVDPVALNEINVSICEGECYTFNGESFCEAGTYDRTVTENGALVDYRIFVSVIPIEETNLFETICFGECLDFNGASYCNSGFYNITLVSSEGCDSIINLNLTVLPSQGPALEAYNTGELDCINTSTTLIATSSIAGSTFSWSGPGINDANAISESPVVDIAGVYTVTATSPQGCTSSTTTEVIGVAGDPVVTISGNVPLNCNNAVSTLTASTTNTGVTYTWTGPDGFTYSGATFSTDIIGVYEVTATTPSGCSGTKSIIVYANNAPLIVDAGGNRHIQCLFSLELDAEGAIGENVEYEWTTWNGNIINGANTLTPLINQPGFYTLTATRLEDGCSGSTTIQVYSDLAVIENDALSISCNEPLAQINASNSYVGSDITFQWSTANGNILFGANTLTPTVDEPGNYQLVISRPGCVSVSSITVANDLAVTEVGLYPSADAINCGESVVIETDATLHPYELNWTKDGEAFSNETSIEISDPGSYTLEVTFPNGCINSNTIEIGVNQDPVSVSITGDLILDCGFNGAGDLSATVEGSGSNYFYQWTAADGGEILSNGTVSSASIFGGGTYCVAVTNQGMDCIVTECVTVEEFSPIEIVPTVVDASCPNATDGSIQLEVIGGEAPFTYQWTTGATSAGLTNVGPGFYGVTLTDDNGCNAFRGFTVESSDAATIIAFAGDNRLYDCTTSTLTLNGEASVYPSGSTFHWTTEDGSIISGSTSLTPIVGSPGTYILTIINSQGCEDSDEVLVFEYSANAGPDRLITCAQPSVQLLALQNAASASYQWSTTNGNIVSGGDSPNPTVDAAGTYDLLVTLPTGCTYTDVATVSANFEAPEVSVESDLVALTDCTNPVTISASSSTAATVLSWSGPGGTANGASFTVFDAGVYTVTATASNGCTNTATVTVIDESDAPDISGPQVQYINCFNGNPLVVQISILGSSGNYDVNWTTEDGSIFGPAGISIEVDAAGTYTVTATDLASGCDASYIITVEEQDAEIEVSSTIASCGIADATATVTTNYIHNPSYLWSTGATTSTITGLVPDDYSVTITGADGGCSEVRVVEVVQESSCFVIVSGAIYEDEVCASAASPMEGVLVTIEPEGLETYTDANGYYEFLVPPGVYTVEPTLISPYVVECPSSNLQVDVPPGSAGSANNNFYTKALSGFDLYLTASSGTPTAGSNQFYQINYCNNWFTTIFGTVEFTHDPLLEFDAEAAGADYYDPATHTAVFSFTDLSFFECEFKSFSVHVPASVPPGTVLETSVTVLPTQGDIASQNNTVSWTRTVSAGSTLTDPNVPGIGAPATAALAAGPITVLDQYPNPFNSETTIEFSLENASDVELQVFDAAGRMVKSYTGYQNGWNKQVVNGNDLGGLGIFIYRIVGPEMVVSGRMLRR